MTVRDRPPLPFRTRMAPLAASTSLGHTASTSEIRRPLRYARAMMARFLAAVAGGPFTAPSNLITSSPDSTSTGSRRLGLARRLRSPRPPRRSRDVIA